MHEDEITERRPRLWRWVALIGAAIVAAPLVLWLIVTFVRSNVTPPRVAYRPVALEQLEPLKTVEIGTVASGPAVPSPVAPSSVSSVARGTTDQFASAFALAAQGSVAINLQAGRPTAAEPTAGGATAGEPIAGPVPLPPRRPKILIAA